MKKIFNILSIAAAITLTVPAFAKDTVKKEAAPAEAKPAEKTEKKIEAKKDHRTLYAELLSITDTLLTVKGGKENPEYKLTITKETKIMKDDKPATVKDATVGQWVGGYVHKMGGTGNDELVSLNLSAKQKEEKKETKEEVKKPATKEPKKK